MNETTQNSQGPSMPKTKYSELYNLIVCSQLPMLGSVIAANLIQTTEAFEAECDGEAEKETVKALLSLTLTHFFSVDDYIESAIAIHNFIDFQLVKKISNDLRLSVQSAKESTLNDNLKGNFLYGLYLSAKKLEEHINSLTDVVIQNKEVLNG